jgi:predicted transcriptional regulator
VDQVALSGHLEVEVKTELKAKERVLQLVESLPDEISLEDIQYHVYVLQKIERGQQAIDKGEAIPHEEVMREIAEWLR